MKPLSPNKALSLPNRGEGLNEVANQSLARMILRRLDPTSWEVIELRALGFSAVGLVKRLRDGRVFQVEYDLIRHSLSLKPIN